MEVSGKGEKRVKNQYFGDDRDLFKYDLVTTLIQEVPSLRRFTFIPLLTPRDDTGQGNVVDRREGAPGSGNIMLIEHLDNSRINDDPCISQIRSYFDEVGIPIHIHKETCCLNRDNRAGYFEGMSDDELDAALIFLDPDNGIEIKKSSEKHVLVSELASLYERMSKGSVLMVFQYRPHLTRHEDLIAEKTLKIERRGIRPPLAIAERDVVFLLFTKDSETAKHVAIGIAEYASRYPGLRCWNL